jgi:hypothetical protein
LVEEREGLVETPLGDPQRSLQIQDHGLVPEDVSGRLDTGSPPRVRVPESLFRVGKVAFHPQGVAEMAPGGRPELIGPAGLRGLVILQRLGHDHRDLRHLDCKGGILRCDLLAFPSDELRETPTQERSIPSNQGETILMGMRRETLPKGRRLGPGPRQHGVDDSEAQRQSAGPVEIEKPAAGLAALRADGNLVEETAVLGLRAVQGQQLVQGRGVQVLVLHA